MTTQIAHIDRQIRTAKPKVPFWIAFGAIALLSLLSAIYVVSVHYKKLLASDYQLFQVRVQSLQLHTGLIATNLATLKSTLLSNLQLSEMGSLQPESMAHLSWLEAPQAYAHSTAEKSAFFYQHADQRTAQLGHEFTAAHASLPTFRQVKNNIHNSLWIYFVSQEGLGFSHPEMPEIPDRKVTYEGTMWAQSLPTNNPTAELVVTDAYQDFITKSRIVTIIHRLYKEKAFLGMLGLDVGVSDLVNLSRMHESVGLTYIIDEQFRAVCEENTQISQQHAYLFAEAAPHDDMKAMERGAFHFSDGLYWEKVALLGNELYAVHALEWQKLLVGAVQASATELFLILVVLVLLMLFLYRLRDYNNTIVALSNLDPLTGLLNRRALKEVAEYQIAACHRNNRPASIVMLDIDYFKKINDRYGHDAGDSVLKGFAKTMRTHTRANDILCRYGGEEFIICLPETHPQKAKSMIERFKALNFELDPQLQITASFSAGIAQIRSSESLEKAIDRADKALLKAKSSGRNRIEMADEMLDE